MLTLMLRPVPAAVFSLIVEIAGFEKAFTSSNVIPDEGIRGVYLWAVAWG